MGEPIVKDECGDDHFTEDINIHYNVNTQKAVIKEEGNIKLGGIYHPHVDITIFLNE